MARLRRSKRAVPEVGRQMCCCWYVSAQGYTPRPRYGFRMNPAVRSKVLTCHWCDPSYCKSSFCGSAVPRNILVAEPWDCPCHLGECQSTFLSMRTHNRRTRSGHSDSVKTYSMARHRGQYITRHAETMTDCHVSWIENFFPRYALLSRRRDMALNLGV